MKTFSLLTCTFFLAILVSSCQKDSQAPNAKTQASTTDFGTKTLSGGSGLSYTVNLGMIDFYPFHGNANDVSGHGHTGILESFAPPPDYYPVPPNAVLTSNKYGIANEAYLFNGISDVIESSTPVFDPSKTQTQFCLYARFKAGGTGALVSSGAIDPSSPGEPGFALVAEGTDIVFIWNDFFPGANPDGQVVFTLFSGKLPAAVCKNSWVDVAVNFSNSVATMSIDGKKVATANSPFPGPAHFASNFHIGYESSRSAGAFFNSAIDEIRVYNRPLTDDEIAYLYAH